MSNVTITSPFSGGVTIIPNQFIEHYMIHANGEFVKIYLYLMHTSETHPDFSLNQIADALNCTEADVLRALKYWEKEGLLTLLPTDDQKPEMVNLHMPIAPDALSVMAAVPTPSVSAMTTAQTADPSVMTAVPTLDPAADLSDSETTIEKGTQTAATAVSMEKKRYTLTADKVKQLKENEDIAELLFIAQQYLGKTLSPTETNRILFFYEELDFSADLIEYLIEYCVSKGHKSMNYIEKVAFAWKEEGITTVERAKKSSESYHKDYYTILRALGIRNRNPIDAEISIMKTWLQEYAFTIDIVVEACTRTILVTKQPSLQYADRILKTWKEAGVHTLADVQKLDLAHEQSKTGKNTHKKPKDSNRFSNFEQRSYDYESLESQLLNR